MRGSILSLCLFLSAGAWAQSTAPVAPTVQPQPNDLLGRSSPRGTLLGFLKAARKQDFEAAAEFLNLPQGDKAHRATLARQLFVVLDRRLPAKLNEVSDKPEGSLAFLTRPDEDLIGTIRTDDGDFDITVEKVERKDGPIWLFSSRTLESVPDLAGQAQARAVEEVLPGWLVHKRVFEVALYEWLAFLAGLPALFVTTVLLSRLLSFWVGRLRRFLRKKPDPRHAAFASYPVSLALTAAFIRWILSRITLPLLARQFWTTIATIIAVTAAVWFGIVITGRIESVARGRMERMNNTGATSVLRLGRRSVDWLIVFAGLLIVLHEMGLNVATGLAGLGVGGIAVALAAQKTLENVIGGVSIIFDKAVHVGDLLVVGNTTGFVEFIGLRSTRIRTFDRALVSVPNGQLATVQLENIACRDKFWFHPSLNLHHETTAAMIRTILAGITDALSKHSRIDSTSIRVNLIRLAPASRDLEVFAYVFANDYLHFLDIQQALLLRVIEIVEAAGSRIAIPVQISYLAADSPLTPTPQGPVFSSRHGKHPMRFE